MKKKIFYSLILLVSGIIIGRKIYLATENIDIKINSPSTFYFLQEGVYSSKQILEENVKSMNMKVVDTKDNKYYVYLGITKDAAIAKRLKMIYEEEGYQIYIKEVSIANEEFLNNVIQFDLLINNTNNIEEILTIEEVVLANYEEIVQKNN